MSPNILELDDYEAANLYSALAFLEHVGGDTGDWYAQVRRKVAKLELAKDAAPPLKSSHDLRRELALRVGWGLLFGGER